MAVTWGGDAALVIFALKNRGAEDWRDKQRDEDPGPANADEGMTLDVAGLSTKTLHELLGAVRDRGYPPRRVVSRLAAGPREVLR